jgi:hypothetical protein
MLALATLWVNGIAGKDNTNVGFIQTCTGPIQRYHCGCPLAVDSLRTASFFQSSHQEKPPLVIFSAYLLITKLLM